MKSNEQKVSDLFFNEPTKEWHFEELLKQTGIARSKLSVWLKKFLEQKLIKKIKPKNKMPHYTSNYAHPEYKNQKKLYATKLLLNSGLLNELDSLKKAKTVIIFGSYSRSDWHKESDIDIFIYGEITGLKIAKFEEKLQKNIELFTCWNKEELNKLGEGLLKNIIQGNIIKGNLDFIKVKVNA